MAILRAFSWQLRNMLGSGHVAWQIQRRKRTHCSTGLVDSKPHAFDIDGER